MSFSQSTSISLTEAQKNEIYKGLKQNEYLKERLNKTESALTKAQDLISVQKTQIADQKQLINLKDDFIAKESERTTAEIEAREAKIKGLNYQIDQITKDQKKRERKAFWKGIAYGGVGGALLTVTGIILLK